MYLEHNKRWNEYQQAQQDLKEVLDEYEVVFQRTQPKVKYGEHTSGSSVNKTEEYVIEVERRNLKRRIEDAKAIAETKKYLLDLAERDLRKSKDLYDLVYTMRWVDGQKVRYIQRKLDFIGIGCSRGHIYEVIKRIKLTTGRDF